MTSQSKDNTVRSESQQNGSPSNQSHEANRSGRHHAVAYLFGLFISSFGSLAYAATLPVLLFKLDTPTAFIGALIGSMRLNTFAVNLFLGHIGDRVSPRRVMIFCELGAALGSALIYLSWSHFQTSFLLPFFIANNVRVFFTALQAGSVQKYAKVFDERFSWRGSMAFWLNGASNGALLFAGLLAIYYFSELTVEKIIFVDFLTFVINGFMLLVLQHEDKKEPRSHASPRRGLNLNIRHYYRLFPLLAAFDLVLSIALCGSNTLNVRLLDSSPELVPLMPALFGGAAFLTSFMSRWNFSPKSKGLWLTYSASLMAQGLAHDFPYLVLGLSVARNLAYWLIFHAINRDLMNGTPKEDYAAVAAGRNALNVGVLATGEFWVGLMAGLSIKIEMAWRAFIAILPVLKRSRS